MIDTTTFTSPDAVSYNMSTAAAINRASADYIRAQDQALLDSLFATVTQPVEAVIDAEVVALSTPDTTKLEAHVALLCNQLGLTLHSSRKKQLIAQGNINLINKLFFEKLESWKKEIPVLTDVERQSDRLCMNLDFKKTPHYSDLVNDYKASIDSLHGLSSDMSSYLAKAQSLFTAIESLENKPAPNLAEQIDRVNAAGFYTFDLTASERLDPNYLCFFTKEIFLSHKNPASKLDIKPFSFGSFKVLINPLLGRVNVYKKSDNIKLPNDSYFHPHVNGSGVVCWGNAAKEIADSFARYDLEMVLRILSVILTSYNEASPYKSLQEFHAVREPSFYPKTYHKISSSVSLYQDDYSSRGHFVIDISKLDLADLHYISTENAESNYMSHSSLARILEIHKCADTYELARKISVLKIYRHSERNSFGNTTRNNLHKTSSGEYVEFSDEKIRLDFSKIPDEFLTEDFSDDETDDESNDDDEQESED